MSKDYPKGKPITTPKATGGAKPQPYIGGLQSGHICEDKKVGIL